MTKKELQKAIGDFLATRDDTEKQETWCTEREEAEAVLNDFARFIGLKGATDAAK